MKQPRKTFPFRNTSLFALLVGGVVFFTGCKKDGSAEQAPNNSTIETADGSQSVSAKAVGAYEGFGSGAVGGANSSTVYHVTNLNSSGSGSLANGIGSNKTIVFDVSGTIVGRFDLASISYLTIDASGQDITINNNNAGDGISFDGANTHHCILKNVHVTNAGGDGINVVDGAHDILITNCTSWGNRDGNIDIAGDNSGQTKNVTVQYCILGQGNTGWSGDMLVTGQNVSVHHNLFSPATAGEVGERCPFVHCNYSPVGSPNVDFRNNIVWKWGRSGGTGSGYATGIDYNATGNVVNNYYYSASDPSRAVDLDADPTAGSGAKAYVAGNVSGNSGVNPNSVSNHAEYAIPASAAIAMQDACTAASTVLSSAGPSPRNATDNAIIGAVTLANCSGGTTNQNPTVNAGPDQTITLPTSTVTLSGSGSDPDGSIASYAWTKVSGTGGTITSASSASTTVTGLTAGSYTFKLTVTDNKGATASDNITITVNSATANTPPTVSAGTNQTITLPTSSVTLTGTASDPDGSIASYAWTKVSGTGGTISSPAAASTTVTGLTAGSYTFKLTVTDNQGATASANVSVTVNSAPVANVPPTVSAGANQTITLPVSSVTLSGTASDPDGSIASYAWSKVSGTGGTISSPSSASTAVTGLTAGSYTFKLTVTDNKGATASANVSVTVNSIAQTVTYGTLTFAEGYNSSGSVNTNQGLRNAWSNTIYNAGTGSFKSEVRAGDPMLSGSFRSQMVYSSTSQNPTEGVVEYNVYYQNWSGLDGGGTNISWQPTTSGAGAILSLQNYNGKFDVVRAIGSTVTHQSGTLMSVSSNTWYKMRWEFKWSTGTDGYARLYINDALYYSYTGKTADGSGQTLRVGQDRWPNSGNTMLTTSICYYDNLNIYTK